MIVECPDALSTQALGERLGRVLSAGSVVALRGPLGAGKTTLTQGVARGVGSDEPVTSPTFVLMQIYESGRLPLYHFDAYRLEGPDELLAIGVEDYLWGDGAVLMEWPERAGDLLPADHLEVMIDFEGEGRRIEFKAGGAQSEKILEAMS